MSDYDLFRLTTRSFEHLVQSIALIIVGQGVTVFGDGPDGGREATFDGLVDFPSISDPWNGYGIIQAKYLQKTQGTHQDGNWAYGQLKLELDKLQGPRHRRKRPKYYIFATNVSLSSVHEKGTKDKINSLFAETAAKTGIAQWRVWDSDQIQRVLDSQESLRRTYAAWITPGDVLAEVLRWMQDYKRPEFFSTINLYLQKQLLADQYAKLGSIGLDSDYHIPLARLFVDLPVSKKSASSRSDHEAPRQKFIESFFQFADEPFRKAKITPRGSQTPIQLSRLVLVGGPGQGKSTLGQYACQILRASFLQDREELAPEVLDAVQLIKRQAEESTDLSSVPRRFPLRVELRRFAVALESRQRSLLSWFADEMSAVTDIPVEPSDLRRWLGDWPCLLVLDGLDEVPPSSNRHAVLGAISDFLIDASNSQSDLITIATTRPQGYNNDFDPRFYEHWWLLPLDDEEAQGYAERLIRQRHPTDSHQIHDLLRRIDQALHSDQTSKLMRSPLQVTIMATLVERVGQAPRSRWRLFREYYDTIYRRELERGISTILRDHQEIIDQLHYEVGFELQTKTEDGGGTDGRMSRSDFEALVLRLFSSDWEGDELQRRVQLTMSASVDRLVFLVATDADHVGFELRSLQEFMAAEHLTRGKDDLIELRMQAIAAAMHWRNVFRFAAGRILAERPYLFSVITELCHAMNEESGEDPAFADLLWGSRMAVDLLEDGILHEQPKRLRLVTREALRILQLSPEEIHTRISDAYDDRAANVFQVELHDKIRAPIPFEETKAAWHVLLHLSEKGIAWARQSVVSLWPSNPDYQTMLLSELGTLHPCSNIYIEAMQGHDVEKLAVLKVIAYTSPTRSSIEKSVGPSIGLQWDIVRELLAEMSRRRMSAEGGETPVKWNIDSEASPDPLYIRFLDDTLPLRYPEPHTDAHADWKFLHAVASFNENPNRESLSRILFHACSTSVNPSYIFSSYIAWPAEALLSWLFVHGQEEISAASKRLSEEAINGRFGDQATWKAAETRWRTQGLTSRDIDCSPISDAPFDSTIDEQGFLPIGSWSLGTHNTRKGTLHLVDLIPKISNTETRSELFTLAQSHIPQSAYRRIDVNIRHRLWTEALNSRRIGRAFFYIDALLDDAAQNQFSSEWLSLIDIAGRTSRSFCTKFHGNHIRTLLEIQTRDYQHSGIFQLISTHLIHNFWHGRVRLPSSFQDLNVDVKDKIFHLVILLALTKIDEKTLREYARLILQSYKAAGLRLWDIVHAVRNSQKPENAIAFLLELSTHISAGATHDKNAVSWALLELASSRSSGLRSLRMRRTLGLDPNGRVPATGKPKKWR